MRTSHGARCALLAAAAALAGCGGPKPATQIPAEVSPEQRLRVADSLMENGRYGDAFPIIQKAVESDPGNAGLRNYLGQAAFYVGRYELSEASYKKALELDPHLVDVHNNLGALYAKTGRKGEAEAEFRKVLDDPAYPHPERAWYNLGRLFASQNRDDEGIRALRKAVEYDPKYYTAQYELASLLDRNGKIDEAVRLYEVAQPAYRNSGEYQYRIGFAYFRLKQFDKAREHLSRALDVAPGSESSAQAAEVLKLIP